MHARQQRAFDVSALLILALLTGLTILPLVLFFRSHSLASVGQLSSREYASLSRSLGFAFVGAALQTLIGTAIAVRLYWAGATWKTGVALAASSFSLSPLIAALIWCSLFDFGSGGVNLFLSMIGLSPVPWLSSKPVTIGPMAGFPEWNWGQLSTLIMDTWLWVPFVAGIALVFFRRVDPHYIESGLFESGSRVTVSRQILIPLALPGLALLFGVRLLDLYRSFDMNWAVFGASPVGQWASARAYVLAYVSRQQGTAWLLSFVQLLVALPIILGIVALLGRTLRTSK